MNYKFTQEQKDWLQKIYPHLILNLRNKVLPMYFKTHYSEDNRKTLNALAEYFTDHPNEMSSKPLIPKKEYLGKSIVR